MELVIVTIAIVAAICAAIYLLDEIIWASTSSVKVIVATLKAAVKAAFFRIRHAQHDYRSIKLSALSALAACFFASE